jgi:hypothetical protein
MPSSYPEIFKNKNVRCAEGIRDWELVSEFRLWMDF